MLLVLHHPGDPVVTALADEWITRGVRTPIVFMTGAEFTNGAGWEYHHPDHEAGAVTLVGGVRVPPGDLTGVFNRLQWLAPPPFPDEADRNYASSELFAYAIAWLTSLRCPVINPASPQGVSGASRSSSEILCIAESAGLSARQMRMVYADRPITDGWDIHPAPTQRFQPSEQPLDPMLPLGRRPAILLEPVSDTAQVYVIGDRVIDAPDAQLVEPLIAFAAKLDLSLAAISLGWSPRRSCWVVVEASGFPPDLPAPAITALAQLLASPQPSTVKT